MTHKRSKTDIHTLPQLSGLRTALRKKLTPAEARLWSILKSSKLDRRKFRRQHSVGRYILDFYCASEKLAVELDGARHFSGSGAAYDRKRKEFLEQHGIMVIRFENKMVFEDEEWVLNRIRYEFDRDERTTPSAEAAATPPSSGGEPFRGVRSGRIISELDDHAGVGRAARDFANRRGFLHCPYVDTLYY
jgi:very-short-patch-repair endonuclease